MVARSEPILMWTIYKHPKDYPDDYVARPFEITMHGALPLTRCLLCKSIEPLRTHLRKKGLTPLPRDPDDEPQIVESWI